MIGSLPEKKDCRKLTSLDHTEVRGEDKTGINITFSFFS